MWVVWVGVGEDGWGEAGVGGRAGGGRGLGVGDACGSGGVGTVGVLQVVSWTLFWFEGVGSDREVKREGLKGEKEFLAFSVFCPFLVLFCNVICGGKGFSFIHHGYERQTETDGRRRRVCFSTRRADLSILLYSHLTSGLCKELCRIPR